MVRIPGHRHQRRLAVVVAQQPTYSLAAFDRPVTISCLHVRFDESVSEPLVISFRMIVLDIGRHGFAKMRFAEEN